MQLDLELVNGLVHIVLRLWQQGLKFKLIFWFILEKNHLLVNSVNMFVTVKAVLIGTAKHYIEIIFWKYIKIYLTLSILVSCILQMDMIMADKRWACSMCPKFFRKPSELRRHEMIHTGEKPFQCTMCDYASNRKANLQSHIQRTHLGEIWSDCGFFKCFVFANHLIDMLLLTYLVQQNTSNFVSLVGLMYFADGPDYDERKVGMFSMSQNLRINKWFKKTWDDPLWIKTL